jgi:hypothetical protein
MEQSLPWETNAFEENIPKYNPILHKAHMDYPGTGEKPVTSHLRHMWEVYFVTSKKPLIV